jgi:hypothetical protein
MLICSKCDKRLYITKVPSIDRKGHTRRKMIATHERKVNQVDSTSLSLSQRYRLIRLSLDCKKEIDNG